LENGIQRCALSQSSNVNEAVHSAVCMIDLEYLMFDEEVAYNLNFTVAILAKESESDACEL